MLFQLLYILLARNALGLYWTVIQFTTPYWIMWYLFAFIVWLMLVPVLEAATKSSRPIKKIVFVSVLLGLVSGFENTLGYYMSLSRIFYFLPFFVMGFCAKKHFGEKEFTSLVSSKKVMAISGILTAAAAVWIWFNHYVIDPRWLWGAFGYESLAYTGYTIVTRIFIYLAAAFTSLFILSITPKKSCFSHISVQGLCRSFYCMAL